MQVGICEKAFCDFVVWSPSGISVERIMFDENLWKYIVLKLLTFHKEYLVTEYFLQRLPREQSLIKHDRF